MNIYDIAKEAGTSISTVSRYLNGKPIRSSSAIKIKEVIEKYNYKPSMIAKGLVSKKIQTVAIVVPDIRIYHYAEIVYTIEQALNNKGYSVFITSFPYNQENNYKDYLETMLSLSIEAVIFIASYFDCLNSQPEILRMLEKACVITENFKLNLPNANSVYLDDANGIKQAVDYLVKNKNRKHIYYVIDTFTPSGIAKKDSFINVLKANGLDSENHFIVAERSPEGGQLACKELLKQDAELDAIIFEEEVTCFGGIKAINLCNKIIGKDVDVISYNENKYNDIFTPKLTFVDTLDKIQGESIVEILNEKLIQKNPKKIDKVIVPKLVVKESA